jgi:sulfate adenylyltransferase subunit 2
MSCTAVDSYAAISEVVGEIRLSTISERGARIDDKRSEAAMEKKNNKGTFRMKFLKLFLAYFFFQ